MASAGALTEPHVLAQPKVLLLSGYRRHGTSSRPRFQLKAMLYHAGILTERGAEPSNLEPCADEWCLREPLSKR